MAESASPSKDMLSPRLGNACTLKLDRAGKCLIASGLPEPRKKVAIKYSRQGLKGSRRSQARALLRLVILSGQCLRESC